MKATKKESSGGGHGNGIYVDVVEIASAIDISNTTIMAKNEGKQDLHIVVGVELKLDIGKQFQPGLRIFGDIKYDAVTGEAKSWGSAFKVEQLLVATGNEGVELRELTPQEETNVSDGVKARVGTNKFYCVPQVALENMLSKKILVLSFAAGKRRDDATKTNYDRNDIVWAVPENATEEQLEETKKRMAKSFLDGWIKSGKKYPKTYSGANKLVNTPGAPVGTSTNDEPSAGQPKDDDLPF